MNRRVGIGGGKTGSGARLLLSLALCLTALGSQGLVATCLAGGAPASPLALGKARLARGQAQQAVQLLQAAVAAAPTSCEAHLCLGQAYARLKKYAQAKAHWRAAVRYGHGSVNAQKANACLLALPANLAAPRCGAGTAIIARTTGVISLDRGEEAAKPTVIDFYAGWCQPCKLLKPALEKARSQYGDRVNFMSVNVDDPGSENIIEKYDVSPIPTLVFLKTDGEVATFAIGYSGEQSLEKGIAKILPSG